MIEMTRDNIRIDPTLEVDTDWNPPCISAYIEIWFDADEKFGTHTHDRSTIRSRWSITLRRTLPFRARLPMSLPKRSERPSWK